MFAMKAAWIFVEGCFLIYSTPLKPEQKHRLNDLRLR